jgi:branched-subunit amino acid transport protein
MNTFNVWVAMLVIGAITYAFRLSFIVLFERLSPPDRLRRALRFVPVAALTAIIAPELMIADGALILNPLNARLLSGILAALVAYRTRNVLLTIVFGMAALWMLSTVVPG